MDPRLLRVYNEELTYLRESAREFGEEHQAVAGRLGLNSPGEPDPYVERLLEGVAFLSARVGLKLEDQFPDFTAHLLNAVQPHYLAPTPSMCVVGFEPTEGDPGLARGLRIPRLSSLQAGVEENGAAPVTFRTAHDVDLLPLRLVEAEYLPSRATVAAFAGSTGVRAEAGLRLRFAPLAGAALSAMSAARLPLFLAGSDVLTGGLYRQLIGDAVAVVARPAGSGAGGDRTTLTRLPKPEPTGFGDECALLPPELRSFRGYRLLSEYFACPERFLFAELRELDRAFATCPDMCDVVVLFSRAATELSGTVGAANIRLFATPAINLFEKQLGRVPFSLRQAEHQLVPDRTRPTDFEVFRILEVTAYGHANAEPRAVLPLYAAGAASHGWQDALYYVPRLRQRRLSSREQRRRRRSDYVGSETWLSITAPHQPELLDATRELAVRALVTNRELADGLSGDRGAMIYAGPSVSGVRLLRQPTKPRPPLGLNDAAWRVIGHLTPNYAALVTEDGDPTLLREHLSLYGRIDDPTLRRQIDGVLSVRGTPVTRRVSGQDRLAFARGLRIDVRLDDAAFENGGMFLFASVLERFLAEFATINSFTEARFFSEREGMFATFPLRTGQKPPL